MIHTATLERLEGQRGIIDTWDYMLSLRNSTRTGMLPSIVSGAEMNKGWDNLRLVRDSTA